jgi:hypothetical protein
VEPKDYAIEASREPRGPATVATLDAYIHLAILRKSFNSIPGRPNPRVRRALAFLARLGHSPETGSDIIDDTRFLLLALNVFDEAPLAFARVYDDFWLACGAISGEVLRRVGQTHIQIQPRQLTARFGRQFSEENINWDVRTRVIAGFIELTRRTNRRDDEFWAAADRFLNSCLQALATQQPRDVPEVRVVVDMLLKFWWNVARKFGDERDVRERLARSACQLLDLILKLVQFHCPYHSAFSSWKEALFFLNLDVTDPLMNSVPDRDLKTIQQHLDAVARRLADVASDPHWSSLHQSIRDMAPELFPYLHGRKKLGQRVLLPQEYGEAEATFIGTVPAFRKRVIIKDVCLRTLLGFRVEVDDLIVDRNFDGNVGLNGIQVQGRMCRSVLVSQQDLADGVTIDEVDLDVPFPTRVSTETISVRCRVLRAWPLSDSRSGWALLAERTAELPNSWAGYLTSLTPLARE